VVIVRAQVANPKSTVPLTIQILADQEGNKQIMSSVLDDLICPKWTVARAQIAQQTAALPHYLDVSRSHSLDAGNYRSFLGYGFLVVVHLCHIGQALACALSHERVLAFHERNQGSDCSGFAYFKLVLVPQAKIAKAGRSFLQHCAVLGQQQTAQRLETALLNDLHVYVTRRTKATQCSRGISVHDDISIVCERDDWLDTVEIEVVSGRSGLKKS